MKAAILITALGSWGVMLFFPWWTFVIPCVVAGIIGPDRGYKAFLSGFIGVGLLWLILALFADWQNTYVLTSRMADILSFESVWLLYVITVSKGAILGALSCLTGYLILGRTR